MMKRKISAIGLLLSVMLLFNACNTADTIATNDKATTTQNTTLEETTLQSKQEDLESQTSEAISSTTKTTTVVTTAKTTVVTTSAPKVNSKLQVYFLDLSIQYSF